jgi:hypothetical protein
MRKTLTEFGYTVISNLTDESTEGFLDFKFIVAEMAKFDAIHKVNSKAGHYSHFFIYYSGHGVISQDYNETCGVDSMGNALAWDFYARKYS